MFKKIYIEISNICNLQCSFCPVVERDKNIMLFSLFQTILKQIKPHTEQITFHLMGEPLAHPEFPRFLAYAEEENFKLNLTTNALLLPRYRSLLLSSRAIEQINFSTHSFSDNYPDRDITPYLQDLIVFTQDVLTLAQPFYVNFRLWNLIDREAENQKANQQILKALNQAFGSAVPELADPKAKKSYRLKDRAYVHFDSQFIWPSPHHPPRSTVGTCHGTIQHLAIHADGKVVPCCLDKEACIVLGDLNYQSFQQILDSPRLKAMQSGFKEGRLCEELCQKCHFIERFDQKAQRLKRSQRGATNSGPEVQQQ